MLYIRSLIPFFFFAFITTRAFSFIPWEPLQPFPATMPLCEQTFQTQGSATDCKEIMDGWEDAEIMDGNSIVGQYKKDQCSANFELRVTPVPQSVSQQKFCEDLLRLNEKNPLKYRIKSCC